MANNKNWLSHYSEGIIRYRWLVIILSVMLSLLLISGARYLSFNNEYRVFFSDDNPQLQAFDQLQRTYTKVDNILFALQPDSVDGFSQDTLAAIESLTQQAWLLPYALRVDSISNFQYSYSEQDDLIVRDLVENGARLDQAERDKIKTIALTEPFIANQLTNEQGSVVAVNVTFQMPQLADDEAPKTVAAARELAAKLEQDHDLKVYLTGVVMLSNSFYESSMKDMGTLIPAMYLVIILVTFVLVRSKSATLATVIVIVMSMMAAMGAAGWLGMQLTPPSSSATTIIMTLAVADSIHILVSMFAAMRQGLSRNEAIKESLRVNFSPVALTSVTTAVGFLSMNFSDSPPFHDLGNITAIGVMLAWLFSITLLPALMAVMPAKARQSNNRYEQAMDRFANVVINKRRGFLLGSIAVSALLISFIPQNQLDDNFLGYFDQSIQFRSDSDFVNDNLTGLFQLQYSLDSGEANGVAHPEFLTKVDAFASWLRLQPEVKHVNTITDTFKRLNKNMHADDPAYYRLPDSKALAAQYLLLYELSLPYGLDLNNQLNIDKSSTQLIVTLEDMPSTQLREMALRGEQWLANNVQLHATGIGPAVMFAYISERNINSMIVGTLIALVVISGLIMMALRSVRIGLLSLIPNLLPAALAFGLWGILVSEVNMAVSMVTGMMLGIVVDDSVHFLSKYLRARREKQMSAEQAVRYAFSSVGVAIVTTSIILAAGFTVLAQSSFGMNSSMALLTAIGIAAALLADFLLLPALLMRLDSKDYQIETESTSSKEQAYA